MASATLIAHTIYYLPFLSDDALISLRYAQRLIEGKGLSWTDGQSVEGYSNFLWVMLSAILGKLGMNLVFVVRLMGVVLSVANIGLIIQFVKNRFDNPFCILLPVLAFYSLSGTIAAWSIGGLEQPLVGFLTLLAIVQYLEFIRTSINKNLWISSIALGLLSITRPDGILIAVGIFAYHTIASRQNLRAKYRELALLSLVPLAFYLGLLLFRIIYYGELVPNTALVKVSPSIPHFLEGVHYNLRFIKANLSLSIVVGLSLYYLLTKKHPRTLLYLALLGLWFAYLSFIGGDIFPAFRHHFLSYVLLMLVIVDGLFLLYQSQSFNKYKRLIVFSFAVILMPLFVYQQFNEFFYHAAKTEIWEWELKDLAIDLKSTFEEEQPLIAVGASGALPYWTGFPAIDMLGLNDYHIPRHKREKVGSGYIGHEFGDAEYVMSRKPDIVQFHIGSKEPIHYADTLLLNNADFQRNYIPISVVANGDYNYKSVLWFNKYSKKVGVDTTKKVIKIPAYLFRSDEQINRIFDRGKLLLSLKPHQSASFVFNYNINILGISLIPNDNAIDFDISESNGKTVITITNSGTEIVSLERVLLSPLEF